MHNSMPKIFGSTLANILDRHSISRGDYAAKVGTSAPQLSKYTGGKVCERAMLPRLLAPLPDDAARAELLVAWLRDQLAGLNGGEGIDISADKGKLQEKPHVLPAMDAQLRKAILYISSRAVAADELRSLILDLELVLRGKR